jgi:hypothetical protein
MQASWILSRTFTHLYFVKATRPEVILKQLSVLREFHQDMMLNQLTNTRIFQPCLPFSRPSYSTRVVSSPIQGIIPRIPGRLRD